MKIIIDVILLGYAWNFTIGLFIILHLRKPKWWLLVPYLFIYYALKEE